MALRLLGDRSWPADMKRGTFDMEMVDMDELARRRVGVKGSLGSAPFNPTAISAAGKGGFSRSIRLQSLEQPVVFVCRDKGMEVDAIGGLFTVLDLGSCFPCSGRY